MPAHSHFIISPCLCINAIVQNYFMVFHFNFSFHKFSPLYIRCKTHQKVPPILKEFLKNVLKCGRKPCCKEGLILCVVKAETLRCAQSDNRLVILERVAASEGSHSFSCTVRRFLKSTKGKTVKAETLRCVQSDKIKNLAVKAESSLKTFLSKIYCPVTW